MEEKHQLVASEEIFTDGYRKVFMSFVGLQVFVYNIAGIIAIEKFAKSDTLKDSNILSKIKWNKFMVYGYFITCVFNNIAMLIFLFKDAKSTAVYLFISSFLFLAYFSIILGKALLSSHFGKKMKSTKSFSINKVEYANLNLKLALHMKEQKPFLQFGLTLSDLASQIDIKERLLSQFINQHYNSTFQDYINLFRINEAKKLIEQSSNSRMSILEIAYESGFNSKSAFNFAFKKHSQTTPTGYKKSLS
ncbi:MAG: AraC family transcriptional regulator [Flavobacteriaceae bacterium]